MTRVLILALVLLVVLIAAAGWTLRGVRWIASAPARVRASAGRPFGTPPSATA